MRTLLALIICLTVFGNTQARPKQHKKHRHSNLDAIDPCRQYDCPKGRQCFVNTTTGQAECMCRPSCKNHVNPVCGSDGILYDNHCELHRAACLSGHHISIMHDVTCSRATTMPPVPPITPVASTTASENGAVGKESVSTESPVVEDDVTESIVIPDEEEVEAPTDDVISVRNCTEEDFDEFKNEVLRHYREQFRNPKDETNPSLPPMTEKFLISFLFDHLDTDMDDVLSLEELKEALITDSIQDIAVSCSLEDFLRADKNEDSRLVAPELYDVFGIEPVSVSEELKHKNVMGKVGRNLVLSCDIETNYNLRVAWERNGVPITEKSNFDGIKMYHGDDRLYLVNVKLLHTGEYTCYAASYPKVKQVHMVNVQVPPTVTMCPHNQLKPRGTTAKVQCYAQGVPTPSKSWSRNQNSMELGEKYQLDDSNSSLMVHHLDYADTGIFDCSASNEAGTGSASASIFIRDSSSAIDFNSKNVYYFFHKTGIQIVEPDTCAFQDSYHADSHLPEDAGPLCHINKTTRKRECNWGSAVNVRNRYVYASQPTENRIIVIDLRLNEIIEVIKTDNIPVALTYIPHLDSLWMENWRNKNHRSGLHSVKVIRSASDPPPHIPIHLEPSGNHFDIVENVYIPSEQIVDQGEMKYGYLVHRDQKGLNKIDLHGLTHAGRINLREYNCHPNSVAFVAIGGTVIVNCDATDDQEERQLFIDYITDAVLRVNDGVQGQLYVTPDGRHVISVDREEQHIQVQKVTNDGKIKTDFQVSTNLHISDLGFYPTMTSHIYDLIATSRNREEAIFINLENGKVEMISGMHEPISVEDWKWDTHNRKIAPSGQFGPYMVSPSSDHVVILNGQYRRLHCDVDHLVTANVFAWVGVC